MQLFSLHRVPKLGRVWKGGPWVRLRPREPISVFGSIIPSLGLASESQIRLLRLAPLVRHFPS